MSEFHVTVVRVGALEKHPNADALSITSVHGYPVIVRTGDFRTGDLAVYVPVDAVVAANDPRFAFLGEHRRIRAKRLRGIFSMGLLTAADPSWLEGEDVAQRLAITKYVAPEEMDLHGLNEADPGTMVCYDLEGLRHYPNGIAVGEEVVITEKIHGENCRVVHDGDRLWVGSRTKIKAESDTSRWWRAARRLELAAKLAKLPAVAFYGECYGYTGGFPYGVPVGEERLAFFDALDTKTRRFLDHDDFVGATDALGLPRVPILYRGPWRDDLRALAEGPSTLDARHIREGIVVRPIRERALLVGGIDYPGARPEGRTVLKFHGEGFLLRKGA